MLALTPKPSDNLCLGLPLVMCERVTSLMILPIKSAMSKEWDKMSSKSNFAQWSGSNLMMITDFSGTMELRAARQKETTKYLRDQNTEIIGGNTSKLIKKTLCQNFMDFLTKKPAFDKYKMFIVRNT